MVILDNNKWEFEFLDRKPSTVDVDIGIGLGIGIGIDGSASAAAHRHHHHQPGDFNGDCESGYYGNGHNRDHNSTSSVSSTPKSLYRCIRPFLIFGRVIGTFPVQGLFRGGGEVNHLQCKRRDFGVLINILISLSLTFCAVVAVITLFGSNNKSVPQIVWASNPVIFYFMGFFCYFYLLSNANEFITLLQKWDQVKLSFRLEDKNLKRDMNLIFGIIFLSAIMENLLQQLIQLAAFDLAGNRTETFSLTSLSLKEYFDKMTQPNWSILFSYNPVLSALMFLWNKFALYGWNYADILIMVMLRASYFQFQALATYTNTQLANHRTGLYDFDKWLDVTKDFERLYTLLRDLNSFLSPLVFVSYAVNLFFITIHIHMALTPVGCNNTATNVYRTWSFFQICSRMSIITLFAARINDYAQEFAMHLRKCPDGCYSVSVQRVERFAKLTLLGVTGLKCFVVTKPFMLSLINVVLTFEIVLLQASGFSYF